MTLSKPMKPHLDKFKFHHTNKFANFLIEKYKLDPKFCIDLKECLNGAAEAYFFHTQYGTRLSNMKKTKELLCDAKKHADGLCELLPLLEMWSENNVLIGSPNQDDRQRVQEAYQVGSDVHCLLNELNNGLDKTEHTSDEVFTFFSLFGGQTAVPLLKTISARIEEIERVPFSKKRGPNKLMPLKIWALFIMRFWVEIAHKKVTLTKETVEISGREKNLTIITSEIARFCKDCLEEIDIKPKSSLRTALEAAKKQFDLEFKFKKAKTPRARKLAHEALENLTDRIPLAII